jgi:hypothetical protein
MLQRLDASRFHRNIWVRESFRRSDEPAFMTQFSKMSVARAQLEQGMTVWTESGIVSRQCSYTVRVQGFAG